MGEWAMQRWFFSGFSKSQESFGGYRRFKARGKLKLGRMAWVVRKEFKAFTRDSAEWSQLFMIAALVVVYLYNFKVLPLERSFWTEESLANLISFLNIGLTGFVVTSLSARFVYPSIGAEGGSFYLIKSSPLKIGRFLFYKYIFYCVPFVVLAILLVVVSDFLLKIEGPIWWISVGATIVITMTVVAMALGFGALYADFKAENRAAALGGMGAFIFLLTCLAYEGAVLVSGAWPAYRLTRAWIRGKPLENYLFLLGGWAALCIGLSILLAWIFLKKGINKLEDE